MLQCIPHGKSQFINIRFWNRTIRYLQGGIISLFLVFPWCRSEGILAFIWIAVILILRSHGQSIKDTRINNSVDIMQDDVPMRHAKDEAFDAKSTGQVNDSLHGRNQHLATLQAKALLWWPLLGEELFKPVQRETRGTLCIVHGSKKQNHSK